MKLIKDNWKPQICNSNKEFPYLIVDNWYNKEEEKLIWKEIDFFTASLKLVSKSNPAENLQ